MIKRFLLLMFIMSAGWIASFAQNDTMYVIKGGNVVGKYNVMEIDSIIFYQPLYTVEDVDGNTYNYTYIGSQAWMTENLKTTKLNDGTAIPLITDNADWLGLVSEGQSPYELSSQNNDTYGLLYNWFAVNTGKLCPTGWHVPSISDWNILINYVGGLAAGGSLKTTGYDYWEIPNDNASNSVGFNGLPAGFRHETGIFNYEGIGAYWWASDENSASTASRISIHYNIGNIVWRELDKNFGYSIRCIKN